MPRSLPKLELLFTFKAVADHGSFTRAARALNQTQSAVSHQIRRLEEELGTALFYRSAHVVQLTDPGTGLLSAIVDPLKQLEAALEWAAGRRSRTRLAIELEPSFSANWLGPRLKKFARQHAGLELQLHLTIQRIDFSGQIELAVKWGTGHWPGFAAERLMQLHFTPMCSPALLAAGGRMRSPAELSRHTLLHDRNHAGWLAWLKMAAVAGFDARLGHVIDDTNVLTQAAIDGHGVALCALELTDRARRRRDLVAPFRDLTLVPEEAYYLLTRRGPRLSPPAQSFMRWLLDEAGASG
jgi:LysR family glycine cleavage system transcriptional activator